MPFSPSPLAFSRPNWAEIDLAALRHNAQILAAHAAPARLVAVMKANAYGHGVLSVARALENLDCVALLGVASVDEARQLQENGIQAPILLLSAILPEEASEVVRLDLIATVFTRELALALQNAAESCNRRAKIHFKIDTGMNRLGANCDEARAIYEFLESQNRLQIEGIYTHFACADEENDDFSPLQLARFQEFLRQIEPSRAVLRHACNSAATLRFKNAHFDLVRPGIALYGAHPCPLLAPDIQLLPVMTWKARITHLKILKAGESVSYGATWTAAQPTKIAVVPCGYADGFLRAFSNRGRVLVNGKLAPVVGRVTMDQILLDVTQIPTLIGDQVTIFGRGLPVETVAAWADTISYELLCAVSARVPRICV